MSEFMEILDRVDKMDLESQSELINIINKRYNENMRRRFIDETLESIEDIKNGNFKKGTSEELFDEIENE